jgi:hypothetical protein
MIPFLLPSLLDILPLRPPPHPQASRRQANHCRPLTTSIAGGDESLQKPQTLTRFLVTTANANLPPCTASTALGSATAYYSPESKIWISDGSLLFASLGKWAGPTGSRATTPAPKSSHFKCSENQRHSTFELGCQCAMDRLYTTGRRHMRRMSGWCYWIE